MAPSIGTALRQAREVRELSAVDAARAAGISPAYLSRLENDAVKKPSPHVLHQLSEALGRAVRRAHATERLSVPGESTAATAQPVGSALFANLTEDERDELLEYLAWYRARRRSKGRHESPEVTAADCGSAGALDDAGD